MAIKVRNVGHVVLKVRDAERAARFYRDVLGLKEVARGNFGRPMVFFSTGDNHHDVAVMEVGPEAPLPQAGDVGLYHVALRIGTTLDELRAAKVGVIRGAKPAEEAAAAGVKAILPYARIEDLLQALKSSEATAAVLPVSELALASRRFPGLQPGVTVGEPGTVSWAVRKEDAELRAALDAHLANLRKTSWSRLVVKYFGDQALHVLGRTR